LKLDRPVVLPRGTPVSQNNVAKEAGTDPTALRKGRYPALIREVQAWVELHDHMATSRLQRQAKRRARDDSVAKIMRLTLERDLAQSQLVHAHRLVLELLQSNASLQRKVDSLLPPPTPLSR